MIEHARLCDIKKKKYLVKIHIFFRGLCVLNFFLFRLREKENCVLRATVISIDEEKKEEKLLRNTIISKKDIN